ncbi:uncharacterized protein LOC135471661 [Liolophura sinensis]|uniref:uncharacterized protein LOC135471661 n=1 Tax=Liolophura sinensis TaxID=3198878 RepID=UPI003157F7BC
MDLYTVYVFVFLFVTTKALPSVTAECSENMGNYVMKAEVVIPDTDPFEYITFVKDGQELDGCSTQNGQITGTGTTGNPYTITITIDPNTPDVGSVDCGFVRVDRNYTWILKTVQTTPPVGEGLTYNFPIRCDYSDPASVIMVDGTGENVTRVELNHVTKTVELSVVKDDMTEYAAGEPYMLGDRVRLRIHVMEDGTGVYGYSCDACNTPNCGDLVYPLVDEEGCETPSFASILNGDVADTPVGTFMVPGNNGLKGMAFTREFSLFRFALTSEVYFRCNLGYCEDEANGFCSNHCAVVRGLRRRKRSSDRVISGDWMVSVITVTGEDGGHVIDHPDRPSIGDYSEVKHCLQEPEYIGVLAVLGTGFLGCIVVGSLISHKLNLK